MKNSFDTAIDKHFRANEARLRRAINICSVKAYAVHGALDDDILFSMQTAANLMPFTGRNIHFRPQTARIPAMLHSARHAVVACRQNMFVFHGNGADFSSDTC